MGRCCDECDLPSHKSFPESWPGPGRFRDLGCAGLVPRNEYLGGPNSSAAYHTNPNHPRGWWVLPAASFALPPPTNVRTEDWFIRRSTETLDVRIKYVLDVDLIIDDLPEGPEKDRLLEKYTSKKAGTPIVYPQWTLFPETKKFKWRGSITIRTIYRRKGMAESYSCYGRGTTDQDVRDGRVTLGFHEWCHRQFFADYLEQHPFPLPNLKKEMTEAQYNAEVKRFESAASDYDRKILAENEKSVDDVGYPKAKWLKTKACFGHTLPLTRP